MKCPKCKKEMINFVSGPIRRIVGRECLDCAFFVNIWEHVEQFPELELNDAAKNKLEKERE